MKIKGAGRKNIPWRSSGSRGSEIRLPAFEVNFEVVKCDFDLFPTDFET